MRTGVVNPQTPHTSPLAAKGPQRGGEGTGRPPPKVVVAALSQVNSTDVCFNQN